jgi:hypothetical protein
MNLLFISFYLTILQLTEEDIKNRLKLNLIANMSSHFSLSFHFESLFTINYETLETNEMEDV